MRVVTPRSKFAAELQPINGWKPVYARDYDGIEWHHPDHDFIVFATPDWNDRGKVTFLVGDCNFDKQCPVATFHLPTQINMAHRVGIYQRQAAKVFAMDLVRISLPALAT